VYARRAVANPNPNDRQSGLVARTMTNAMRNAVRHRDELRYRVARELWSTTKRFGSPAIRNVELADVPGLADAVVEGYIDDPNRVVLAALCGQLGCTTFFEIGTNRGRTAWTVARNNPDTQVYTLDLPEREAVSDTAFELNQSDRDFFVGDWDRGDAYRGTPEEERITTLLGDSATFDFAPYRGSMDFVFVDGAHSYEYVESDTKRALEMLAPDGTLAWDDYPAIPGVYNLLHELAPELDAPLYHLYGTRLVVYSRSDVLRPRAHRPGGPLHAA
jgi:hypothetical protein